MRKLLLIGALYILSQLACSKQAEEVQYIQLDSAQIAYVQDLVELEVAKAMDAYDYDHHLRALDNISDGLTAYKQEEYFKAIQHFAQATRLAENVFNKTPALDTVVYNSYYWTRNSYEQIGDEHSAKLYENLEIIASSKL